MIQEHVFVYILFLTIPYHYLEHILISDYPTRDRNYCCDNIIKKRTTKILDEIIQLFKNEKEFVKYKHLIRKHKSINILIYFNSAYYLFHYTDKI